MFRMLRRVDLPVRMFWNASSTLLASRAEVSMKERLFSARCKVNMSELRDEILT